MIATAGESARRLGPSTLNPILLDALLGGTNTFALFQLALAVAPKILPAPLVKRIANSEASEAHLTNLGRFLRRYGEVLQSKDAAFKALVERELKKRKQQRPRRP